MIVKDYDLMNKQGLHKPITDINDWIEYLHTFKVLPPKKFILKGKSNFTVRKFDTTLTKRSK